jgi:hypothetical protein
MLSPPMKTSRPSPARSRAHRLLISASAVLLILGLAAFHAILLWQRVLDLSLFKPIPAIRWLATAALIVSLYRLHRQGVSLVRGRSAVVLWLLVLVLHVSFWVPLADASPTCDGWTGAGLLLALPAFSVVLGLVSPSIRRLLARALDVVEHCDLPRVVFTIYSQAFAVRAGHLPSLACRPPPAFAQ